MSALANSMITVKLPQQSFKEFASETAAAPDRQDKKDKERTKYDEVCRVYMRGHCPWGKKCDRIHPPKSAPSATEAPQALTNPSTSKLSMPLVPATEPAKPKELCRDFAKAKCSAGDRCPRLHASKAEASITKPTELVDKLERHTLSLHTSDSAPNKPKTTGSTPNLSKSAGAELCLKFTNGKCNLGDKCRRIHSIAKSPKAADLDIPAPTASEPTSTVPSAILSKPSTKARIQPSPVIRSNENAKASDKTFSASSTPKTTAPAVPVATAVNSKEICRDFAKGKCTTGDRCPRLHFITNAKGVAVTSIEPIDVPDCSTSIVERPLDGLTVKAKSPAQNSSKGLELCIKFSQGNCKLGEKCPRLHPVIQNKTLVDTTKAMNKSSGKATTHQSQSSPVMPSIEPAVASQKTPSASKNSVIPEPVVEAARVKETCRNCIIGKYASGDRCRRLHPVAQLEGDITSPVKLLDTPNHPVLTTAKPPEKPTIIAHKPSLNTSKRTESCLKFATGKCKLGEKCPRIHEPAKISNLESPEKTTPAPTIITPAVQSSSATIAHRTETSAELRSNKLNPKTTPVNSTLAISSAQVPPICRDYLFKRCQSSKCNRFHPSADALEYEARNASEDICREFLRGLCPSKTCPKVHPKALSKTSLIAPVELNAEAKAVVKSIDRGASLKSSVPDADIKALDHSLSGSKKAKEKQNKTVTVDLVSTPQPRAQGNGPRPASDTVLGEISNLSWTRNANKRLSNAQTDTCQETTPLSPIPGPSTTIALRDEARHSRLIDSKQAHRNGASRVDQREDQMPYLNHTISDHVKVRYGDGFAVLHIVTGFESCWVVIGKLPLQITQQHIASILEPFGRVMDIHMPPRPGKALTSTVRVQFSTSKEATLATASLNGNEIMGTRVTAQMPIDNSTKGSGHLDDVSLRITWDTPGRCAFAGYATRSRAQFAVKTADGLALGDNIVAAEEYEGLPTLGTYNVRFRHLPPTFTPSDMTRFGEAEEVMLERPNYAGLDTVIKGVKEKLALFNHLIDFEVSPPPRSNGFVVAYAHFANPTSAKAAASHLNNIQLPVLGKDGFLRARHMQTVSYIISARTYDVIGPDLSVLKRALAFQRSSASLKVTQRGLHTPSHVAHIKLSAEDPSDLSRLKFDFESIIRGEVVRDNGQIVWDDYFGLPAGQSVIRGIERRNENIIINASSSSRRITIIGPRHRRQTAQSSIIAHVRDLRTRQIREIPLAGRLVAAFMDAKLLNLQKTHGPSAIQLDLKDCRLIVRGDDSIYETAQRVVQSIKDRIGASKGDAVVCPVCLDVPTSPVSLGCGHTWCKLCLRDYLLAATGMKKFPLQCLGAEASCGVAIPLAVARENVSSEHFDTILNTSFTVYIDSRPTEFYHCPTPDCSQIYRPGPQDTVLQCPSCLSRICPHCHITAHDHISCSDRDIGGDKLLRQWEEEHDVKKCPGCQVLIEKLDGCNHMTCTRCQTHVCWVCMAVFDQGNGVYDHMRNEHGSLY